MLFGFNFCLSVMYLREFGSVSIMPIKKKKQVKKKKNNFMAAAKIALELEGKDKPKSAESSPSFEKTTVSTTTQEVGGKVVAKSKSKTVEKSGKSLSVIATETKTEGEIEGFDDLKEKDDSIIAPSENPLAEKKTFSIEMLGGLLVIGIIVEIIVLIIIFVIGMLK